MDAVCAKNLYAINDNSSIDKIALALEETIKELSGQYYFPRGIARNKFRRHFKKQQKETNENGEDDRYVDVYHANAVDNLVCKLKRQLFTERAKRARTTQLLLMNAINHLERKYKHRFDNMRLQFHVWGVVKRKCKKYANKLLNERVKEVYAGLGIVNR